MIHVGFSMLMRLVSSLLSGRFIWSQDVSTSTKTWCKHQYMSLLSFVPRPLMVDSSSLHIFSSSRQSHQNLATSYVELWIVQATIIHLATKMNIPESAGWASSSSGRINGCAKMVINQMNLCSSFLMGIILIWITMSFILPQWIVWRLCACLHMQLTLYNPMTNLSIRGLNKIWMKTLQ